MIMCSLFGGRTCPTSFNQTALAPDPIKWQMEEIHQYDNGYILKVLYPDCINFEGRKIMVYKGKYSKHLDPHFVKTDNSPIAGFKPTHEGMLLAHF